jgi:DNA-binding beta-propeller fold protein YncE
MNPPTSSATDTAVRRALLAKTAAKLAVAVVVASLAIAGDALAATGDLTFAGCDEDEDIGLEGASCTNVPGLLGASDVVVSADGTSAYVASVVDDAIVHFVRDPRTGALGFRGCFEDDDSDFEGVGCANAPGLNGASDVELSADGASAYVVSVVDNAIVHFARDPRTGALSFLGCGESDDANLEAVCAGVPGLDGAFDVELSADGTSAYVVSGLDSAIVHFARNTTNGALGFQGCGEDDDADREAVCAAVPGLHGPTDVALSADGTSAYVVSDNDDAFVHFARNTTNGALGFLGCGEDEDSDHEAVCAGVPGLDGAFDFELSADGTSAYVASGDDNALVHFARNSSSGALGFLGCVEDEDSDAEGVACDNAPGLHGASDVELSADGSSAYVGSSGLLGYAIVHFARDPGTGALGFQGCVEDEDTDFEAVACDNAPGLAGAFDVALTADGTSAYVASRSDNAIVHFAREQPSPPPGPGPRPGGAGTPGGGGGTPRGSGAAPLAFGAKARVTLSLAARRIPVRGPLKVRIRNANGFEIAGRLFGRTTKAVPAARKRRVKLRTRSFGIAARARKTVALRLPRTLRPLLRRNGRLALRLTATVTDPARNTRTVRKKVTPKLKQQRRRRRAEPSRLASG